MYLGIQSQSLNKHDDDTGKEHTSAKNDKTK